MQNIIKIFLTDMKGLVKNKLALAIAIGVCVLPSLYAWFNIYSNWDPYANTANIKVAVSSDDKGYKNADGEWVNMGDSVIDGLRENTAIDWQFVDTSEAIDGVKTGEYYASIVIGENFSSSMYDFYETDLQRPSVTYYENQKKNAVASKITDSAKSTVQKSINTTFISVVVEKVTEGLNGAIEENDDLPKLDSVIEQLDTLHENLEGYNKTLDDLISMCNIMSKSMALASDSVSDASGHTTDNIDNIKDAQNKTNESMDKLSKALTASVDYIEKELKTAEESLSKADITEEDIKKAQEALDNVNKESEKLEEAINQGAGMVNPDTMDSIDKVIGIIQDTSDTANEQLGDVLEETQQSGGSLTPSQVEMTKKALQLVQTVLPLVEKQMQSDIASIKSDLNSAYSSMIDSMSSLGNGLNGSSSALASLSVTLSSAASSLEGVKSVLISSNENILTVKEALESVSSEGNYEDLLNLMVKDPESTGEFFSGPVQVDTKPVYESRNYGSSVTPFYTILALWVGCTILVSIIKVDVTNVNGLDKMRPFELYFGRMILFFIMGQLQTLIIVLGNLFILKVQCANPGLFYLDAAFSSLIFCMIIYTFTTSFGDIGKAIVVIVMVLQIAGSSGTYPIEILPAFNQKIYIYFPFPYAINAMREAMFGMYHDDYWVYLGELSIFGIISLFIGLVIRRPFMNIIHYMEHRMKDTKMM